MRRRGLWGALLLVPFPLMAEQGSDPESVPPVVPSAVQADTVPLPEQQPLRNAPTVTPQTDAGPELGVWVWDRTALLASPALTFADLLGEIPGIVLVRGGDLGAPVGISAFGLGAGQIRIFLDGVEEFPVEGGALDLSDISMVGLDEVRVERSPSEIRIHLRSHVADDVDPYTLLEVGTGDLRTNLFRVGFVHPQVAGGSLLVALDRADTDGPRGEERGSIYGTRFQYSLFPTDAVAVTLGYRSRTSRRPGSDLFLPAEVNRSELRVRVGWEPSASLRAQLHGARVSGTGADAESAADTLLLGDQRQMIGATLQWADGPLRVWASGTLQDGEGWAQDHFGAGIQVKSAALGGILARWDREGWSTASLEGRDSDGDPIRDPDEVQALSSTGGWSVQGWTVPQFGVSFFAQMDHGTRGVPFTVGPRLEIPVEPDAQTEAAENEEGGTRLVPRAFAPVGMTARDGLRAGARLSVRGLDLSGAWFRVQADSLPPLGLALDRNGRWTPGGERSGFEVMGTLSLEAVLRGLSLAGSGTFWDEEEPVSSVGWAYVPERAWDGRLTWYRTGYEDRLETWVDVGVRGRDRMLTSQALVGGVPQEAGFSQNWYTRIQVRVATVRVFIHWDNLAFRDQNEDLPGRFLPQTRAMYGIRWTMRN